MRGEIAKKTSAISFVAPVVFLLTLLFAQIYLSLPAGMTIAYAQEGEGDASFDTATVSIPNGAANPTVDLTFENLANWYEPRQLAISSGDTVVWKNEDTEPHTVTSGRGAGLASVQTNEKGDPDDIFDSDFFGSGESWSYTFHVPGTYSYFCTIHPWMEGVIEVEPVRPQEIPSYPVDASGNRHERWPVHTFSNDGAYDIDMKWDPASVVTGNTITFFVDFFDAQTNERLQLAPFEFVLLQDGRELDRTYGLTDVGTAIFKYELSSPGPITMKVEKVGEREEAWSEFTTYVYPNADSSFAYGQDDGVTKISGGTEPASRLINPLTLVTFTYLVIFGLPAAVGVIVILFKKGII